MKSDWKNVCLGDLVIYLARGITPSYVDQGVRVVNQKCIRNGRINYSLARATDLEKRKIPDEKYLQDFDVLVNSTGVGTLGRVAQVKGLDAKTTVDSHVTIVRPGENIDKEFFGYALAAKENQIESLGKGSTGQTELSRTELASEIILSLPPLDAQRKIAQILAQIDRKILINNLINHNLEQIAQAIFKSWFVDFQPSGGMMPDGWKKGVFGDVISATTGGDWGKDAPLDSSSQKVFCMRGADIPDVNAGNRGKMPIRYIPSKNYIAKQLAIGDIVVEISGGSPTQSTGRCALITQSLLDRYNYKMVCTNFCRAVKPLDAYSSFVYYYWKYLYARNVMFSYENGTTGIKNLDISSFLKAETITIPPVEVVQKFSDTVGILIDAIFANGLENETLTVARDTLLPRLMSGELLVSSDGAKL